MDEVTPSKQVQEDLQKMHGELVDTLRFAIKPLKDPDTGQTVPPPAAYLSVALKMLADNKITALPVKGSPLAQLEEMALPFKVEHAALDKGGIDVH